MTKEKNVFDPEVLVPRIKSFKQRVMEKLSKHKKLIVAFGLIILVFLLLNTKVFRKSSSNTVAAKSTVVKVEKNFEFPAVNSQGKQTNNKIKFSVSSAEKTNQVLVNDKVYVAKNNKMFLIVNLELKNDATSLLNILPGDLVRLAVGSDDSNKFAPDLHNNLVPVAAISTKMDKIGFVIPQEAKDFKLYVGELEGKKETVSLNFPS